MNIVAIDHVVLRVRDLESMISFYRQVLGCEVDRRRDELGLVHLRAGRSMIDLVDLAGPLGRAGGGGAEGDRANMDHLALQVASSVEEIVRELARHGITVEPPAQRYGATGTASSVYLQDPEGNAIELRSSAAEE